MAGDSFKIRERGSTARTEVLGGITTFTTMAYIIGVNPAIVSFAGFPTGPSTRGGDGGRSLRRLDWR